MSGTATKEKLTVRHLLVVLTGIMITFGCSALCFSTWGLFQPVVAEGLGVEVTAFAMYVTVMYLTMTIASPFAGKLLQTMDIRILLSASAALVGCAFLLMSFSNTIVLFYVAAVMLGLGEITILWLAIPTLINRWFVERAGFFIGLCMAFTGIGGAIWSAVFTALTASGVDFHTIYLIWGVIALVTSLPFTLFCVRNSPEDCGLAPYGASMQKAASGAEVAAKPAGLSAGFVMKTPMFYAICVFAGLINIAILIAMQFPTYTKSLTDVAFDVAVVGGVMTSVMMVGQAIFKVVLGAAADKNAKGALIFAFAAGVAGILLCWFGTFSEYVMYVGAFIFGGCYATAVVLVPVICRQSFGTREYSRLHGVQPHRRLRRYDLGVARLVVRLHRRVHRGARHARGHPAARPVHLQGCCRLQEGLDDRIVGSLIPLAGSKGKAGSGDSPLFALIGNLYEPSQA